MSEEEEERSGASVRFTPEAGAPGNGDVVIDLSLVIAELQALNDKLDVLKPCICEPEPESNLLVAYPAAGGLQALAAGTTTIDYVAGTVAGAATANLSRKLAPDQKYKSVRIYTDQDIDIQILDGGTVRFTGSAIPGYTPFANLKFERIKIITSVATNVQIVASLKPYALYGLDITGADAAIATPYLAKGTIVFNTAILAGADIFDTALTATTTPCLFRIGVALDAAGVLSVRRTRAGVTVTENLNHGVALTAVPVSPVIKTDESLWPIIGRI